VIAAPLREATEIEAAMTQWGRQSDFGLIVPPHPATNSHRTLIPELAARNYLPTIYALRAATTEGA